jgi:diguanylate cyclase (GGDEF)-like protein
LEERLEQEFERAQRYQLPFSLLLMDIDHFKSVNDAFGHRYGDRVLIEFSQRLKRLCRSSDLVFRYGGDEFIVLLPHTARRRAQSLAQRLLDAVRSTPFSGDPPLNLTLSIGVASFPEDVNSSQALISLADQRHYQAKRQGRDQAISEELIRSTAPALVAPSRLIERDRATKALHDFMIALGQHHRGVLRIEGQPGMGRSRLLIEAGRVARLMGYTLLDIRGKPGLKSRVYGAMFEALEGWDLPSPWSGADAFAEGIEKALDEAGGVGLLVSVDESTEVDYSTMELWRDVFFSAAIPRLALIYTFKPPGVHAGVHLDAPVRDTIILEPLTRQGLQVWVRQTLQWEAPLHFVNWLYEQTEGFPKRIQHGLNLLMERGLITRTSGTWSAAPNLEEFHLAEQLASQLAPSPNNLPDNLTEFVGREVELRQIRALIRDRRLVTLLGPGGIGKSRLAIQVAAENLGVFPDGVYFISLASVRRPEFIVSSIAEALNFSLSGSREPRLQLLNYLSSKETLLVLDNLEHLADESQLLVDILERAPGTKILATSRLRLNLQDEMVYELGGLPYPEDDGSDNVESYCSVQLFLHNTRREIDFSLTGENKSAVAQICRLVQGHPLGIELAAPWVQVYSPLEIIDKIEHSLAFLTSQRPEAHSLMAVFDSYWEQFSEPEQGVLRKLSLFRGSFSAEAAHSVTGASPFFLAALVTQFYLHRNASGRYAFHELLRQYSEERLSGNLGERDLAIQRYCRYYADFLARRLADLKGGRQRAAAQEISTEIENVRVAWSWMLSHENYEEIGRSAESLYRFYEMRSWFIEGQQVFEQTAQAMSGAGREAERDSAALGEILAYQGWFHARLGQREEGVRYLRAGLEILRRSGSRPQLALCLNLLGCAFYFRGKKIQALEVLEDALSLSRQLDDLWGVGFAQNYLGNVNWDTGNYALGKKFYEQSLETRQMADDLKGIAISLNNLGYASYQRGEYQLAQELLQESLSLQEEIDNRAGMALALNNLGYVNYLMGDYIDCLRRQQESLEICQDIGDRFGAADALHVSGFAEYALAEYGQAEQHLRQALEMLREIGTKHKIGYCLIHLGVLFCLQGDYSQAAEFLEGGLAICEQIDDAWGIVLGRTASGKLAAAQEHHGQAEALFLQAFQECQRVDALYLVVDVLYNLACSWIEGDYGEWAYQLLSLIHGHPASNKVLREKISLSLSALEKRLQPEIVAGLEDRFTGADLFELAAEIVGEASWKPAGG